VRELSSPVDDIKARIESLSPEWKKILEEVLKIYSKRGISEEEVYNQLLSIYSLTRHIEASERDRLIYAIRLLKAKSIQQFSRPTIPINIIPVGITAPAYSQRRGTLSANLIGIVYVPNQNPQYQPAIVKLYDQAINFLDEVEPFRWYKLTVIKGSRIYIATSQSILEKDKVVTDKYEDILNIIQQVFRPKYIAIKDGRKYASRTITRTLPGNITREFIDPLDTRLVSGIILRGMIKIDERSGIEKGLYIITDDSVPPTEQLDEEGYPIPMNMFVWTHKRFMVYDVDSQVVFFGTVRYIVQSIQSTAPTEEEAPQSSNMELPVRAILTMNAYWVFPTPFVRTIGVRT